MGKHIGYLVSHGHTARGAYHTGLLRKLVDAGNRVTVITQSDPEGELGQQTAAQKAGIEFYKVPSSRKLEQLNIFRGYVHQDIRENPALWEKYQRRAIDLQSSFRRRVVNAGYLRLGDMIRRSKWLTQAYTAWEKRQYSDSNAVDLLRQLQLDVIISTRPMDHMEAFLLNAARKLKLLRVMYVLSWDNITAKGVFPERADHYLTWGPIMNAELKEYYGAADDQLHLTGVTHFDLHCQVKAKPDPGKYLQALGLDREGPYLFFTMSASYYAPNEIDIAEWLANSVETGLFGDRMQLVLRPHMHNFQEGFSDLSWGERLEKLRSSRVAVDFPNTDNSLLTWYTKQEDMRRLSNLLAGASVCMNSGSTIAIEACLLDRPTIITLFDTQEWPDWKSVKRIGKYLHLQKLFKTGAVRVVGSFGEFQQAILAYLENDALDREHRERAVREECFRADGHATDRFVENINRVLDKNDVS